MTIARFSEVFVPIFVALSPLTVLPIFLGMTEELDETASRRLAHRAVATGFIVAAAIVLIGQSLFRFLGITLDDLRVAGGLILLLISIHDLIYTRETRKRNDMEGSEGEEPGVVPLGIPLIVGPATLTAAVVLADSQGRLLVLIALAINLGFIGVILHFADLLNRLIHPGVSKAFGKVMSLFLAAIAVSMLRTGVFSFIQSGP